MSKSRAHPWGILALALASCVTTTPTSPGDATVFKVYEGTYRTAKSSEGVMKNWVLYSNGLVTGDWVTKKNSRTLGIREHWEPIGRTKDRAIEGTFVLFVDQDTQWVDVGAFSASEWNQEE